jgi:5-methylcytosine-specific restriction endonuclease McrA
MRTNKDRYWSKPDEYREKARARGKKFYLQHRDKILLKDKEKRELLIKWLGSKCQCGYTDIRALTLDHKAGDGYLDRKLHGSKIQRYYYNHLEEASANLQVLCFNCNRIKQVENDEFNHSRRLAQTLAKMRK